MIFEQPLNSFEGGLKMKVTSADELRNLYNEAKGHKWIYTEEYIDDMCKKLENNEVAYVYVVNAELAFGVYYNDPSNLRRILII